MKFLSEQNVVKISVEFEHGCISMDYGGRLMI